jgi:membrane fusion protein, multidrug efflux system
MRRVRPWLIALGVVVLLGTGAYVLRVGSGNAQSKTSSPSGPDGRTPPVPVVATAACTSDVAVYLAGLGSVTPLNTVTVHTRVDGELTKVLFQEGRRVNAGDLLAEIDPRPFQVQLTQAQVEAREQDEAVRAAERSLTLTTNQYRAGIVSYLNVVIAQTAALTSEQTRWGSPDAGSGQACC